MYTHTGPAGPAAGTRSRTQASPTPESLPITTQNHQSQFASNNSNEDNLASDSNDTHLDNDLDPELDLSMFVSNDTELPEPNDCREVRPSNIVAKVQAHPILYWNLLSALKDTVENGSIERDELKRDFRKEREAHTLHSNQLSEAQLKLTRQEGTIEFVTKERDNLRDQLNALQSQNPATATATPSTSGATPLTPLASGTSQPRESDLPASSQAGSLPQAPAPAPVVGQQPAANTPNAQPTLTRAEPAPPASTSSRRPIIPDIPRYYGEKDKDEVSWEEWKQKVNDKFEVDDFQFPTEKHKLIYARGHLRDSAYRHVEPYTTGASEFKTYQQMIDYLEPIVGDAQNCLGFHKDPGMTICKGCQDFRNRLFDSKPLQEGHIAIHKNFAELSNCADTSCDLCKYIRREFCYHSSDYETYSFNDEDLQDVHSDINVNLFLLDRKTPEDHTNIKNRLWQFFLGRWPGPSNFRAHNDYVKDRSLNRRILGDNLGLDRLLFLSRQWLTTCTTEHKKCGPQAGNEPAFLPTRLLDVGQPGQQSIRLVLSEDLPKSKKNEYATLSYCWGEAKYAACTTKENLVERLTAIPARSLPKTLQDAIEITRAFRVRYLWIDALCIIQVKEGENEDWQREFPNMGKVYRHSLFTIAASGAKNSSVGCFYRREASRWPVQNYFLVDENRAPGLDNPVILEATLPNWNVAVEHSALAKRGWALQERMLASRTLFWTEDGLFWDCSESNASECEAKLLYSNRKFPMLHELVESVKGYNRNSRYKQKIWTNVLEEFSQKALTVVTDKLPAVAGLGNELSRLTGQEFEMGVWKHNLVQELAWVADFSVLGKDVPVDPQAARLPKTPSWSWASTHQKLHFKPGRHGGECEELVTIGLVSVPSVSVNAQQLRVRGRLGELRVRKTRTKIALSYELVYHPTRCTFEPIRAEPDEDLYNEKQEVAVLDTLADALPKEGGTIRCLQWMKWEDHLRHSGLGRETRYHKVTGALIVSQVDEKGEIYRRIGWLEVVDDDFFKEENETIILV